MRKQHRLTKNKDFISVYKKGKSTANRFFVLYIAKKAESEPFRLGVSISKKVGNAVVRNRIKRLVKAVFLDLDKQLPSGYDFIIIARNAAASLDFAQTQESLLHILKKAKVDL